MHLRANFMACTVTCNLFETNVQCYSLDNARFQWYGFFLGYTLYLYIVHEMVHPLAIPGQSAHHYLRMQEHQNGLLTGNYHAKKVTYHTTQNFSEVLRPYWVGDPSLASGTHMHHQDMCAPVSRDSWSCPQGIGWQQDIAAKHCPHQCLSGHVLLSIMPTGLQTNYVHTKSCAYTWQQYVWQVARVGNKKGSVQRTFRFCSTSIEIPFAFVSHSIPFFAAEPLPKIQ